MTTTRTTAWVADSPTHTLSEAGLLPDDETAAATMAAAYGAAWLATAGPVGERFGCEVEAIIRDPADSVSTEWWWRNDDDTEDGPTLAQRVWQAMHDAVDLTSLGIDR